jgi:hypothetical protein
MEKIFRCVSLSVVLGIASVQGVAAANDFFRCDRIYASDHGFKDSMKNDPAALNRMYPLELKIVIAEDRSWAASYYGVHRNRSKNFRKYDIIQTTNGVQIYGKELRTTGEINITFNQGGKKTGFPARYQCDKPNKTRWEPDY